MAPVQKEDDRRKEDENHQKVVDHIAGAGALEVGDSPPHADEQDKQLYDYTKSCVLGIAFESRGSLAEQQRGGEGGEVADDNREMLKLGVNTEAEVSENRNRRR